MGQPGLQSEVQGQPGLQRELPQRVPQNTTAVCNKLTNTEDKHRPQSLRAGHGGTHSLSLRMEAGCCGLEPSLGYNVRPDLKKTTGLERRLRGKTTTALAEDLGSDVSTHVTDHNINTCDSSPSGSDALFWPVVTACMCRHVVNITHMHAQHPDT